MCSEPRAPKSSSRDCLYLRRRRRNVRYSCSQSVPDLSLDLPVPSIRSCRLSLLLTSNKQVVSANSAAVDEIRGDYPVAMDNTVYDILNDEQVNLQEDFVRVCVSFENVYSGGAGGGSSVVDALVASTMSSSTSHEIEMKPNKYGVHFLDSLGSNMARCRVAGVHCTLDLFRRTTLCNIFRLYDARLHAVMVLSKHKEATLDV